MAPKTKEQFEEIRQRSISAIKQAALELFAHQGYHSTSISSIAKEAGISKGLMYNYFDSKEALLMEIIEEAVQMGEHILDDALQSSENAYEQLEYMTKRSMRWIKRNFEYWKLLFSIAFQPDVQKMLTPLLKQKEEATMQKSVAVFEKMGVEKPMQEMLLYGAMMDGIAIQYMQWGDNYPLEEMIEMILKKYRK